MPPCCKIQVWQGKERLGLERINVWRRKYERCEGKGLELTQILLKHGNITLTMFL